MPCFVDGFHAGHCSMTNLTDCICINVPLQAGVSQCVQTSCEFSDQYDTALVSQELCKGYPTESRRRYSRIFSIALPTISATVVALRCWARYTVTQKLWWDDWSALIALFFLVVSCACGFANAGMGFGEHYWDVEPGKGKTIIQLFYAMQMFYTFMQVAAKTSICCFYYRVFTNTPFLLAVKGALVFILLHGAMFLFLVIFQCLPVQSIWDRSIEGKCLNITAIGYGGAAISIFEDIVLFIMPVPELLKLQLSRKKKWALVFMFGIGSFACIASMIRLKYLVSLAHTFDATWDNVDVVLWSSIEVNLAIVCGSLPALRPLFKRIPALLSTAMSTARSGTGTNRRPGAPTPLAKVSNHSRPSCAMSAESSPRRPILAEAQSRGFGSSSTVKVSHSTVDDRLDLEEGTGSRDDLEQQDWAAEKPAS
ncbi:integral membrane protein [Colletotrichum musicola]|uniref:Integral membrane protein n=1 Tax=Colletotrichum musicola TaxID=2175873 RepID=A0A8H6NST9_9PEZI|nr:integral membrane protein [Colletotrichum musicola]